MLKTFGKKEWQALSPFLSGLKTHEQRYIQLKLGIFQLFSLNEIQRENKIRAKKYKKNELPSSIYSDIKIGLGDLGADEKLVMRIFKTKLPVHLIQMLTPFEHLDINNYILIANQFFKNGIEIGSVDERDKSDNANLLLFQAMSNLQEKVEELTLNMAEHHNSSDFNTKDRDMIGIGEPNIDLQIEEHPHVCFFHRKFGDKCWPNKCKVPCEWSSFNKSKY